jgi:hypothetical protein
MRLVAHKNANLNEEELKKQRKLLKRLGFARTTFSSLKDSLVVPFAQVGDVSQAHAQKCVEDNGRNSDIGEAIPRFF